MFCRRLSKTTEFFANENSPKFNGFFPAKDFQACALSLGIMMVLYQQLELLAPKVLLDYL